MPEEKSKDDKLIEKAAKILLGTEAMSRLTKTPIHIDDLSGHVKSLVNALSGIGITSHIEGDTESTNQPSTGRYYPSGILVRNYNAIPDYSDVAKTIHHEDIHALLEKSGYKYPSLTNTPDAFLNFLTGDPAAKATEALINANRVGNLQTIEPPAYVGAYDPSQMPGFTEADRQAYLKRLMPTLQPNTANLLQRIIQSYQASQNPPF